MRVRVDEPRRGDAARGVELRVRPGPIEPSDGGDTPIPHRDVAFIARRPRTVDDGRVTDDQVEVFVDGHILAAGNGPLPANHLGLPVPPASPVA